MTQQRDNSARYTPGLVSVVIPSYQRGYIIGETIASVLKQTYKEIEIIIVDDGSTDNTAEVVAQFDNRVRYIRQANAGVSAARNTGLRMARGEFVALLDSDDQWLPWKIEAQVAFLRRFPAAVMVWTDMLAVNEDGSHVSDTYLRTMYNAYNYVTPQEIFAQQHSLGSIWTDAPPEVATKNCYFGDIFSAMMLGSLVHTSTVLMRRERLLVSSLFDESMRCGEDYKFHLQTCSNGPVGLLDLSTTIYRIGASDQITAGHLNLKYAETNLETIHEWTSHDKGRIQLPTRLWHRRMADSYAWLGREQLKAGQRGKARRQFLNSLRWKPAQPKVAALCALSMLPTGAVPKIRSVLQSRKLRAAHPSAA